MEASVRILHFLNLRYHMEELAPTWTIDHAHAGRARPSDNPSAGWPMAWPS